MEITQGSAYVADQLRAGVAPDAIKAVMRQGGWPDAAIAGAFAAAGKATGKKKMSFLLVLSIWIFVLGLLIGAAYYVATTYFGISAFDIPGTHVHVVLP